MVLGVIASLNASGEIQKLSDTSQNLGTPLAIIATDAVNDIGVVITSSPGLISFANKAVVIADVAEFTDTENLILMDFDHLTQIVLHIYPKRVFIFYFL